MIAGEAPSECGEKKDEELDLESSSVKEEKNLSSVAAEDYKKLINTEASKAYSVLSKKSQEAIFNSLKSYTEETIKGLQDQMMRANDNADRIKKELEDKIENSRLTTIETLGIFVALFTFISVDFQVFRSYRNYWAISGLTLIFLGSIFLFITIIDFFILQTRAIKNPVNFYKKNQDKISSKSFPSIIIQKLKNNISGISLVAMSLFLITSGIFLFSKAPNEDSQDKKDTIKYEVLELVKNDLNKQGEELRRENNSYGIIVNDINDDLTKIKKCIIDFGFTYKCFE
jgi:hypothetical protein